MRITRIFFFTSILSVFMIWQSFGIDFGGIIDNASTINVSEGATFAQKDKLSLWLEAQLSNYFTFSIQGSYTYSIDRPYLFDLDLLNLEGQGASSFSFTLGRFAASDFSQNILDHNIDGLLMAFNFPIASISVTAGYAGLLLRPASRITISRADASDASKAEVFLAPPRLVESLKIVFSELLLRQSFTLSFLAQQDLRSIDDVALEGGKLHSQYTGLGISGPIVSSLYYDSFFYLGTGKTLSYINSSYVYKPILSFLGGGELILFMEEALFSRLGVKFLFSSGDADYSEDFVEGNTEGLSNIFIPISRPTFALVFSPQPGNIFLAELSYSIKPHDTLQTLLKVLSFFRPTTGQISEPGINTASDSLYLGTEIDLVVNFRPFSDLGAALSSGFFIPNNGAGGAFLESDRSIEFLTRLEFSFSF